MKSNAKTPVKKVTQAIAIIKIEIIPLVISQNNNTKNEKKKDKNDDGIK